VEEDKKIFEKIDKTLNAFERLPKLEANQFLFTRIESALDLEEQSEKRSIFGPFNLRYVGLAIILILNIIAGIYFFNSHKRHSSKDQLIESLSKDYNLSQNEF